MHLTATCFKRFNQYPKPKSHYSSPSSSPQSTIQPQRFPLLPRNSSPYFSSNRSSDSAYPTFSLQRSTSNWKVGCGAQLWRPNEPAQTADRPQQTFTATPRWWYQRVSPRKQSSRAPVARRSSVSDGENDDRREEFVSGGVCDNRVGEGLQRCAGVRTRNLW